jgi:16S rRNA (adenine1518-N6/adenine1519-N6)-dimethyltransferase
MKRPRRRLGQHFLHDPAVIGKILTCIAPGPDDRIVEIGGGHGALTRPLLAKLRRLDVVELDRGLAAELAETNTARCAVHWANALAFDFSALAPGPRSLRIVGNLPYNLSTPLLFHLLEHRAAIKDMHLMLQKEVVDRIIAMPGQKSYGRLTVMLAAYAEAERCFDIGPGAFTPPPRVWSSLVRFKLQTLPRFPISDPERFARIVLRAFSMRRKTLGRTLREWLSHEQIASLGIDPRARAETLAPPEFARLAELIAS